MLSENFSEKVSVNINSSTLSSIDLLVDNGYYSNRSDFINQALRDALQRQQSTLDRIIEKQMDAPQKDSNQWFIGVYGLTAKDVEALFAANRTISISGYGVLWIDEAADAQKLFAVLESIHVKGRVNCTQAVKQHYGLK